MPRTHWLAKFACTPPISTTTAPSICCWQTLTPRHNTPGALIWLADENEHFTLLPSPQGPARVFDAAPASAEGRLDLLGLTADGQPIDAVNRTTKNYHWQIIRPRAHQATGDQRINSFGIGGQIEIRSGLLVQMQPINGPQLHFGLGNETGAEVARIVWPNGTVRAEFALKADQEVLTEQRLKGSCPFLFAWNGTSMQFVKDTVPWGAALGLRIDSMGPARIAATEEWYKIPGSALAPRDGSLDLRITGELWETYYYDSLALMAVDHPAGTEIFTDERFAVPPVKLAVTTVAEPHAIARAIDDSGNDVTETLRDLDGKYLDTFGRGQYQGVTRDHYVEIDLGDDLPASGPLWLIARGWLHPSDSSINVAMSQGDQRSSAAAQSGNSRRPRRLESRARQSWLSRGPQQDLPHRSHWPLPRGSAAQAAPAHESRNLLGSDRVGAGTARCCNRRSRISIRKRPTCTIADSRPFIRRMPRRPRFPITTSLRQPRRSGAILRASTRATAMCASCLRRLTTAT